MAENISNKNSKSAVKDLTTGTPLSLILGFALPLLGGMLFQQFYGLVDTLIVGRFLGVEPLAGVGSTGAINFMVIGFVMGVCNGFAIPISQRFGAGDYCAMRRFYANSILLAVLFAAFMTTAVSLLTGQILTWMKTPSDIFGYAYTYILIIFLGIPAVFLYNLTSAAIRALGDSKAPVFFLIVASVINIVLDLVFIIPCKMGVAGAALATDLSQAISGVLCVLYIRRKVPILGIQPGEGRPDRQYISLLIKMGVPMGLQYSITAIGSVILQTAVNSLGSLYVAANTAAGRVLMFLECPFDALGSTMATYGGQNVGAGKKERLTPGLWTACLLGIAYSAFALILVLFLGDTLTGFFIEKGAENRAELLALGKQFLVINCIFFTPLVFVNCVRFMIQGMGFPGIAILSGVMEMIGRTAAAFLLVPAIGYTGACLASPIAWILADCFLWPAYFNRKKHISG